MGLFGGFTQAVSRVFGYASAAVSRGLEVGEAFTQYVAGGGTEGEKPFSLAQEAYDSSKRDWSKIGDIPREYRISSEFALDTGFDWREEHVMKMEVLYRDNETGEHGRKWVTVESNTEMTRQEWEYNAQSIIQETPTSGDLEVYGVISYEYYT
jgi:hypothetical protein